MSELKVSAVKDWLKRTAIRVGEAVLISTVAEKLAPTAKTIGSKVMDKLSAMQGRKNAEELEEMVKESEEKAKAAKPVAPIEALPTPPEAKAATDGPVDAKFG